MAKYKLKYKCINQNCKFYDRDFDENCSSRGIRYDGHRCRKAITVDEQDPSFEKA